MPADALAVLDRTPIGAILADRSRFDYVSEMMEDDEFIGCFALFDPPKAQIHMARGCLIGFVKVKWFRGRLWLKGSRNLGNDPSPSPTDASLILIVDDAVIPVHLSAESDESDAARIACVVATRCRELLNYDIVLESGWMVVAGPRLGFEDRTGEVSLKFIQNVRTLSSRQR